MYMSNTRTDVPGRQGFIDNAAASRITKPGVEYDPAPWRTDVMHSVADREWSVP
jgi:hypothetical protein